MGEIHNLAINGNIKGIKKALSQMTNKKVFLSPDKELGWSPMHYASHHSKAKIVQLM